MKKRLLFSHSRRMEERHRSERDMAASLSTPIEVDSLEKDTAVMSEVENCKQAIEQVQAEIIRLSNSILPGERISLAEMRAKLKVVQTKIKEGHFRSEPHLLALFHSTMIHLQERIPQVEEKLGIPDLEKQLIALENQLLQLQYSEKAFPAIARQSRINSDLPN